MNKLATLVTLLIVSNLFACKPRDGGSSVKNGPKTDTNECKLEKNWAGRMGMRLIDAPNGKGALISCVVVGEGLHHIGLSTGDTITALNQDTKVLSALGFEDSATKLVRNKQKRIHKWEFAILRNGQKQKIKPLEKYAGCGLYTYDDCGPLNQ